MPRVGRSKLCGLTNTRTKKLDNDNSYNICPKVKNGIICRMLFLRILFLCFLLKYFRNKQISYAILQYPISKGIFTLYQIIKDKITRTAKYLKL